MLGKPPELRCKICGTSPRQLIARKKFDIDETPDSYGVWMPIVGQDVGEEIICARCIRLLRLLNGARRAEPGEVPESR